MSQDDHSLPSLYRDNAFWGMTSTQFLGAFNDSVFKQIVLLLCVAVVFTGSDEIHDQQFLAQGIFSIAFILLSGISGYWSDRVSKRSLIVLCKVLEIGVMLGAVAAFFAMPGPEMQTGIEGSEETDGPPPPERSWASTMLLWWA